MSDQEDFELLPSFMQMEAAGNSHPTVRRMARRQRKALKFQALDDQVFAALLDRVGGDETTARIYWTLGRQVRSYMVGPHGAKTVDEVLEMFDDEDLDALAEQTADT